MEKVRAVYIPGLPEADLPLARFLPPLPAGAVRAWLESAVPASAWLLDPFGSTPALALEIARTGRRALVACNNPLLAFCIETLATVPQPADFQSALAELGSTRRGVERLETHLQSLYATPCPGCGQTNQAAGFLWRKGEPEPYARLLRCPACNTEGEYPLAPEDRAALETIGSPALHRSRALGRIFLGDEGDADIAESVVQAYVPRALYVLIMLINRVDGLPTTPQRKRLLTALMVSLLDEGSALWSWPSARSRPRQLSIPPQFKENNLWLALETAGAAWSQPGAAVPVTHWPELPPESGGICLYPGRLRALLPLPAEVAPAAAAAVLPRPNAAFWTLSAAWTGWLWGREAAQPLKVAFERRRYDWHWHASALFQAFSALNQHFEPGLRLFAHLPELAPGFLSAALAAGQAAGLALDGVALRTEAEPGQIYWRTAREKPRKTITTTESLLRHGMREYLLESGEPASYLSLYAAGVQHMALEGGLPGAQPQVSAQVLDGINAAAGKAFTDRKFLERLTGGASEESGLYWLARPEGAAAPMPERLDAYLHELLAQRGTATGPAIEMAANRVFRGLHTPPAALLRAVMHALSVSAAEQWKLRDEETPAARSRWPVEVNALLTALAARLGLVASGRGPLLWGRSTDEPLLAFTPVADGAISAVLLGEPALERAKSVLVIPAHREPLVALRIQRDPRLATAVQDGWRLLRDDALRGFIARQTAPTLEMFEALLNGSASESNDATQMSIF